MSIPQPVDAIILCLSGTGLAVARSLGRLGLSVGGIDTRPWEIGHFSRYLTSSTDLSLTTIQKFSGANKPLLLPCGDVELEWTINHRASIEPFCRLPGSIANGQAAHILNKRSHYKECMALGINMPRTWIPNDDSDVRNAAKEALFPVLIKPAMGGISRAMMGGSKVIVCHASEELIRHATSPQDIVIQEIVPGPDSALQVYAAHRGKDGKIGPWVTAQKERQYPRHFGSGTRVVTTKDDEVAAMSHQLLESLDYQGPCGVEWKRLGDQLIYIEMNPRPVLWYALADAVIRDTWHDLSDGKRHVAQHAQSGISWQFLVRDFVAAPLQVIHGTDVFCTIARDDPMPGLLSPLHALTQFVWSKRGRPIVRASK